MAFFLEPELIAQRFHCHCGRQRAGYHDDDLSLGIAKLQKVEQTAVGCTPAQCDRGSADPMFFCGMDDPACMTGSDHNERRIP